MRDYVLHQSKSRSTGTGLLKLRAWVQNWQYRRQFAALAKLSDYQLKDIGLTRAEVVYLAGLPLSVDPGWEADRLRLLNSRRAS